MDISFTNKTKHTLSPQRVVLWKKIAESALPKNYELSIVFVGDARIRTLNRTYRAKDKPTNVLAFPVSEQSGELYLDIGYALKEAPRFVTEHPEKVHVDFLFIHGLLHLAGYDHGDDMEREEHRLMKRFISQRA